MANKVYDVYTDLNPEDLTTVAAETYRQWLQFAMGRGQIGGKTLAHPSGRYAAALSWKKTGAASVAIIADEKVAPEVGWIEEGRAGADMKAAMLGKGNTKVDKDGYRYRVIPMRKQGFSPFFGPSAISSRLSGESLKPKIGKMWGEARATYSSDRMVTMSDRPGSASWQIEPMQPYAPGSILRSLLQQRYGT